MDEMFKPYILTSLNSSKDINCSTAFIISSSTYSPSFSKSFFSIRIRPGTSLFVVVRIIVPFASWSSKPFLSVGDALEFCLSSWTREALYFRLWLFFSTSTSNETVMSFFNCDSFIMFPSRPST